MKIKESFHPYALTTSVFWSLAYVLTRECSRYLAPVHISILRCIVATCALLIVVFAARLPRPRRKDLKWFFLSGLSGICLYMFFFNKGCALVTTATGNVMLATTPVLTAIGARVIFKEKLQRIQWAAIVICFAGVIVLTVLSGGFSVNIGLLWLMIAVVLMSIYNLLQKYLSRTYPTLTITAFSFLIGTLGLSVFAPGAFSRLPEIPGRIILLLIILGLCCSALAYCSWTKAFSKAKNASSVSNYMFINPFISAIFGWFIIGDRVDSSALCGGAIIMAGLFLFNFGGGILRHVKERTEK